MNELTDPRTFTGCAEKQTEEYLEYEIKPLLEKYRDMDDAVSFVDYKKFGDAEPSVVHERGVE